MKLKKCCYNLNNIVQKIIKICKTVKEIVIKLYRNIKEVVKSNSKVIKEIMAKTIKNIMSCIKAIYSIIEVLSTLTIFSTLIIFVIGKTRFGNVNDDDLTMHRIQSQIPDNLTISDIRLEDIHGLGNDSIIVLAVDDEEAQIANQILIFDKVDNDILNQFNNLFRYGSNYRLSYSFSLEDPEYYPIYSYSLEIVDMVDLTGDLSKEIIVQFMPYPCGNGAYYQIGIFSYSYDTNTYYLLGTYPEENLYDYSGRNIISTVFHDGSNSQNNYYNKNEKFELEFGSKYTNDFFAKSSNYGTILVRTGRIWGNEGNADPHRFRISLFRPIYNFETNELNWEVLFSKETNEYIEYCTKEYVQDFLKNESRLWEIELNN